MRLWRRRGTAGKARHREIEAAPEEMHRAGFADEAGAKVGHHARRLNEGPVEAPDIDAIVLRMGAIAVECNAVFDFARRRPDLRVNAEPMQPEHEFVIEVSDCHRLESDGFDPAIAGRDTKLMVDKIEGDIERRPVINIRRRQQSARGHQESRVPPVINERGCCNAHLPRDLRP